MTKIYIKIFLRTTAVPSNPIFYIKIREILGVYSGKSRATTGGTGD
jgi:hypothetical protein